VTASEVWIINGRCLPCIDDDYCPSACGCWCHDLCPVCLHPKCEGCDDPWDDDR